MLPDRSLIFIDPPYYNKGSELYTSFYEKDDHALIRNKLLSVCKPWMLTYDDDDQIRYLYRDRRQYLFDIGYSLQEKRIGNELLIASKGLRVPSATKERQVNRPQHRAA